MLTKYISLPVFLISFVLGLISIYIIGPEIKTIYIYPSPTNSSKIQYKDSTEQCFNVNPILTQCPINPYSVKKIPMQN